MVGILGPKLPILLNQIRQANIATYLEIGCYRCDTMRAVRAQNPIIRAIGFDLFNAHAGDADAKGQGAEHAPLDGPPISVTEARLRGFEVYPGDSKATLPCQLQILNIDRPALVFLDGGHSYETARADYQNVARYLPDAIVIIDDVDYPGVARLIRQIDKRAKTWIGYGLIRVDPIEGRLPAPDDHD